MSRHDDDLTRHNTRPQAAAKCKNGENCFGIGRTDHYHSFKKISRENLFWLARTSLICKEAPFGARKFWIFLDPENRPK